MNYSLTFWLPLLPSLACLLSECHFLRQEMRKRIHAHIFYNICIHSLPLRDFVAANVSKFTANRAVIAVAAVRSSNSSLSYGCQNRRGQLLRKRRARSNQRDDFA